MTRAELREIAFKVIFAYLGNPDGFDMASNIEIAREERQLANDEYQFICEVVNSFKDNFDELKAKIEKYSTDFEYSRIYKVDLALLFLALTEIYYIKTPVKVVINEIVNLAKQFSTNDSPKYINGILAQVVKESA